MFQLLQHVLIKRTFNLKKSCRRNAVVIIKTVIPFYLAILLVYWMIQLIYYNDIYFNILKNV